MILLLTVLNEKPWKNSNPSDLLFVIHFLAKYEGEWSFSCSIQFIFNCN